MVPNTASRLIAMAASLTGDVEVVRSTMNCSGPDFRDYCAGLKEPTGSELDRLITLIVREQAILIAKNRDFVAQARKKHEGS